MFTENFNAPFTLPGMDEDRTIDRVLRLAKARGMNQSKLATEIGVSPQDITNWKSRGMPAEWLVYAARAVETTTDELLGLYHKPSAEHLGLEQVPEYAGIARPAKFVPVVGTARMGDDGFYEEISSVTGAGDGHIEIQTEDPNAYGLRVRGQSMFPAIRDGWYVLVEPNGQPREGEYVLLKLQDGRKMVKELMYRRSHSIEVMSVNGGARITFDNADLQDMQAVGAVVSPSKWRPD